MSNETSSYVHIVDRLINDLENKFSFKVIDDAIFSRFLSSTFDLDLRQEKPFFFVIKIDEHA